MKPIPHSATTILLWLLSLSAGVASTNKASTFSNKPQHLFIRITDRVLNTIDPRLFGQFMERPAFSGEIGIEAAVVPGTHDLQPEAARLIREMKIPVIRFPGGTDIDFLDWTDMIDNAPGRKTVGRPISRPNRKLCTPVSNAFGYDEFLRLCEHNGSEADLVVNFRDGLMDVRPLEEASARAAALVAYCNAPLGHPLPGGLQEWPKLRAANGHPEPYRVKYVQIGNETWMFDKEVRKKFPRDPEAHWHKCLKAYIRAILEVDPSVKLIIDPSKLTAEEIWKAWVSVPAFDSNGQALLEDEHLAQARKLGTKIAVSEWNWNGWWDIGKTKPALDSLYAKGLGAASMLHSMMRQGDLNTIGMQSMLLGCHWPIDSIRVDRTGKHPAFMMPTGMVASLYSQNHGERLLEVELSGQEFYGQPYKMHDIKPADKVAAVDVVATRNETDLTVHMINRSFAERRKIVIDCSALGVKSQEAEILIMEGRLEDKPPAGGPQSAAWITTRKVPLTGATLQLDLPARSIVFARFSL